MAVLQLIATTVVCYLLFMLGFRVLTTPGLRLAPAPRGALAALFILVVTFSVLRATPGPWTLIAVVASAAFASMGLHQPGLAGITEALGRWRFPVYMLAATTVAALIFVFVPITTFLTSPGELAVNLSFLFGKNVSDAMMFVYVAALLYALAFTPRMRTALATTTVALLLLTLIYAYFLPFGYPQMSGLAFEQVPITEAEQRIRLVVDLAVVMSLGLLLAPLLMRVRGKSLLIGIALVDLALCAAAGIQIYGDTMGGAGGPEQGARLSAQPLRFSTTEPNVLIVFLDRFMGSYVESTLESDPDLALTFSGFTWYPRTVSAGENSIAGLHPMLGGYDYLPVEMNRRDQPLRDLSVEAFSILPYNFAKHGWDVNLVSPRGLGFTMAGDCSYIDIDSVNCTHIPETVAQRRAAHMGFPLSELAASNYTDLLVMLAGMRAAPYSLKELLLEKGPWRPLLDHSAGTTFREWAELGGLDTLTRADAQRPTFNFVSNLLAHEPYYMGEDCLPQREAYEPTEEQVVRRGHVSLFALQHAVTARCVLLILGDYLEHLRQVGVYDNTHIVVVSDHGIVGKIEDSSTRAAAGSTQDAEFVRTRSLLLVKPRNAKGPLAVSEAFAPNAEVPRIVCAELGGCVNPYLDNKPIVADGRDDPFYISLVPWQFNQQNRNSFVIYEQIALRGKDPFDAEGWETAD